MRLLAMLLLFIVATLLCGCSRSEADTAGPPPPTISGPAGYDPTSTTKPSLAHPFNPDNSGKK